MAKIKWFSYLLNEEGQPISGASISIYLANSETPALIYTSETDTTATSGAPQLQTNSDGYFEFWLGYIDDNNSYEHNQKFKIAWDKSGITNGYNDYISIVPPNLDETWEPVNESDTDTTLNKTVSNYLAKGWEDHKNDMTYYLHGIEAVDETDDNAVLNKLVSNELAKGWEDHKDDMSYYLHGLSAVDEYDSDPTLNKLVSNEVAKKWEDHKDDLSYYLHGLSAVDEYDSDPTLNKLVSNELASGWEDHKDDMSYYVHGLSAIDVNDPSDTTRNKLLSNADYASLSALLDSYSKGLSAGSLTPSGDLYWMDVFHELGEEWPYVTVYDEDEFEMVMPERVTSIDPDTIRIWFSEPFEMRINISKS